MQTLALAEAAAERAAAELAALASWDDALAGAVTAAFFDGATACGRAGGAAIDLDAETALAAVRRALVRRPVAGRDDGRPALGQQQPAVDGVCVGHGGGAAGDGARAGPGYAVVWVGDDPAENDADPLQRRRRRRLPKRAVSRTPACDAIGLRAVAWGARGSRRELEWWWSAPTRRRTPGLRVRVWREVRGALP